MIGFPHFLTTAMRPMNSIVGNPLGYIGTDHQSDCGLSFFSTLSQLHHYSRAGTKE